MAPFFVLEDFISYLKIEKRYSEHTAIAYEKDILQFFEFGDFKSSKDLSKIPPDLNAVITSFGIVSYEESPNFG
jgi:site-specific recombinase XerD